MRIIATLIWCVLFTLSLAAQREVPITTNSSLEKHFMEELDAGKSSLHMFAGAEKEDCNVPVEEFIPVTSGLSSTQFITIDTAGLDSNGMFTCLNCDDLLYGSVTINGDTLIYQSNMGLLAETETVSVVFCDADGQNCSSSEDFDFLIRRAGQSTSPATIIVNQGEAVLTTAPNDLPGALRCNFFIDCPDNYEGRDQLAYFTDYSAPINEFIYKASRFAGDDAVCLVLCDEFGICDTTNYTYRIDVPSRSLPVYDDFSYAGPVPSTDLWLDQEVYVNTELAINPRSVGVASFDGISNRGRSYGLGYGESDRLTSTYLNTSSGDWTLSFWLQRGGLTDRPETRDSLVLQFRNASDEWVSVHEFTGIPANQPFFVQDTFRFYVESITPEYQHDRFQFRFVNWGDRSGFRDVWHLDYLRLDNNTSGSTVFDDIAFTKLPEFLLEEYTSMPWRHFQPQLDQQLSDSIQVGVYNHFSSTQNAGATNVRLEERVTGINPFGIVPTLFNGQEANLISGTPINRAYSLNDPGSDFSDVWAPYTASMGSEDYDNEDILDFELTYTIQNSSQDGAEFVAVNDAVSRTTRFSNYFAYDDGTAESAIETSAGQQVAVGFEASVPDTIQGVRFHFPHTSADITSQELYINVWIGELDDTPEYRVKYQPVYASTFFDTLQGFTSYELKDIAGESAPVAIPAGDFYVGWEQVSTCQFGQCIAVGYDRNRPQGLNSIFVNPGGGWESITGVTDGALMLRPVMSGGEPVGTTSTTELPEAAQLTIYPNPSRDLIYLEAPDWADNAQVEIFSNTGQLVHQQVFNETINISTLPAGAYFVRLQGEQGNHTAPQRLIVIK